MNCLPNRGWRAFYRDITFHLSVCLPFWAIK